MDREDRLMFRVSEAAELLGLGRSKVYALAASGELPVVKVGNAVRLPAAGLRQWVEEQTAKANDPVADH